MGAVSRDLVVEQGTTWSAAWQVKLDGVDLAAGDGWQARAQVRASKASPDVLHVFTAEVVGSIVRLSVLPDDSSAWLWRRGVYDLEIFDTSTPARVVRVVEGSVLVNPEVTRGS